MTYIEKVKSLFTSRRFQAAVLGVLEVIFQDMLGLTPDQALMIAGLIGSWVVGDSLKKTGEA